MITVSTSGMAVSLKTDLRFPMPGQQGHESRNTQQMKNCNLEVIDYQKDVFQMIDNKQDKYITELQKNSYATKFIELLAELQNGFHPELLDNSNRISKKDARLYLGINTSANFSNNVLRKTEVISYCEARNIRLQGQFIKIPKAG